MLLTFGFGQDCDEGYTEIGEFCYYQADLDVLQILIDNSAETIYMDMDENEIGVIETLERGEQNWGSGEIIYLSCFSKGLSGEIPVSIGDLESIQDIELYGNQLTGPIPPEIGNLEGLTNLRLSSNQLTGSIPPEIGNLVNFGNNYGSINLSNNQLTGYVPESFCNLNTDNISLTNNNLCPPYTSS